MSRDREQIDQIVAAVPKFEIRWKKFLDEWKDDAQPPWYVGFGELAHYVVECHERGTSEELPIFFSTVESALKDCSPELENLIAVGLFEDIQNIASHRDFGAEPFRGQLGPRSRAAWDQIDEGMQRVAVWAGKNRPKWWQFWRRKGFDPRAVLGRVENPELKKIIESQYRKIK